VLQRCRSCRGWQHYPRALCTHCGGLDLEYAEACGRGLVDTATEVHRAPSPDVEIPYVIARVRVQEGLVLLTRLVDTDPETRRGGSPVVLAWSPAAPRPAAARLPPRPREALTWTSG